MERKNTNKRRQRTAESGRADFNTVARAAFLGIGAEMAAMLVLSLGAAGLCMLSPDPASLTLPVGIALFCLSSLIGGAVSAARLSWDKTAAVVSGAVCGFSLIIITGIGALIQGLLVPEYTHGVGLLWSVLLRTAALPLSAISAFLVVNKRKKPRRHRR